MKEWLAAATEPTIIVIDGLALLAVVIGTAQAVFLMLRDAMGGAPRHWRRAVWIQYARWLIAALTFQLAADIIESSISTRWEDVARLGAIAVIRTFLNYFLEKDINERRDSLAADDERART